MEDNETSQAARSEEPRNVVILLEEANSYIASAKERMNDVIETFISQAQNSIKINDFSQIFKTVNVWVKLRPRKLSQYAEIISDVAGARSRVPAKSNFKVQVPLMSAVT